MQIYHNPRCKKSRETLAILEQNNILDIEIINYLKIPPSIEEIKIILKKLAIEPFDLVRNKEEVWKNNYNEKKMTNDQIIGVLADNPRLIERPIVIKGSKAVIGRPPENVLSLLS